MKDNELIAALKQLKVETGSLACLGCGYADHCSTYGCAMCHGPREPLPTPAQRKQLLADGYQVVVEGKERKGGKQ